ncbi:hypothetical protein [Flavobacterium croceum]|uniref:hypothetical protein n=1 Tax=Flavobacterium croceum TaxID=370975 RepID=UPI0024A7B5A4|nr:hypothetical protein [Flavobacterium croceum]
MKEKLFQIIAFIKACFIVEDKAKKPLWAMSFFLALAILLPKLSILFKIIPKIEDFSGHILSNASLNRLDIAARVSLFYKWIFGVSILSLSIFAILNYFIKKRNSQQTNLFKYIQSFSIIGIFSALGGIVLTWIDFSVYFIGLFVCFLFLEVIKNNFNQSVQRAILPVLVSIPYALFIYVFLKQHSFFTIIKPEITQESLVFSIDPYLLVFLLFQILFSALFYIIIKKYKENQNLFSSSIYIVWTLTIISVALEFSNILNVRFGFVFNHPFLLFGFILLVTTALFFFKINSKRIDSKTYFNTRFIPVLLLGLLLILTQPWRMYTPANEFFETANHGISVDHFFRYGSIPLVETFDAHMLNMQFFAYLYGVLNGYEPWSPFLYASYAYVLEIFATFYILKRVLGTLNSFLIVMCVPFIGIIQNEFAMAGFMILFLDKLMKSPSTKNYYWFWAVSIFLCLYKLDVGYAAVLSGLTIYVFVNFYKKNINGLKKFAFTGAVFGGSIIALFFILCLIKGINPITRLQEFIITAMSNQNWAVTKMGDVNNVLFKMAYYILPILTVALLIKTLIPFLIKNKTINTENKTKYYALLFFVFYALFFVFNAPRGIVRHNFEYLNLTRITSMIPLAILMYIIYARGKKGLVLFMSVFLGFYVVLGEINMNFFKRSYSLMSMAVNSDAFQEKFLDATAFNGTRLRYEFQNSAEVETFKKILNVLLKPNETYYDFSSTNYYHALVGRKNPSYINQTPLMINGDKGQEIELENIKNQKIPIILMPIKNNFWHAIDEVYVDLKYYKMSEYIYQNYEPLYRMASFDIYVLKDKQLEFKNKLATNGFTENKQAITDFSFLIYPTIQNNSLQIAINQDKTATINSPGSNAFFIGMLQYLRHNGKLPATTGVPKMVFKINALAQGNIKIYYKLKPEESFSETQVKEFPLNIGENDLNLSLQSIPDDIMFAVNTSSIVLKELDFISGSQSDVLNPEKIDYNAGFIPLLWGEKGNVSIFSKVLPLKEIIEGSAAKVETKNLNKQKQGCFAYIEIESSEYCNGKIELMANDISKAGYNFSIDAGKHQYAIRISNGYYWWHTTNPLVTFKSDKNVKISKFSVILEDGSQIENIKEEGITLANLNDDNWTKGCSSKYKMLAMEYAPKKEKLLQQCKKIKTPKGTIVPITGYYVSGGYINITINENVEKIIDEVGYPNQLQFVK